MNIVIAIRTRVITRARYEALGRVVGVCSLEAVMTRWTLIIKLNGPGEDSAGPGQPEQQDQGRIVAGSNLVDPDAGGQ
jgi:hypothetical protein